MARVLRSPLVRFLALGGVLLALRAWWFPDGAAAERPRIVVGPADVARLREAWAEDHGAPPGRTAEDALVHAAIDEEILFREALALGFDRHDDAVRERLVRLAGFVGEEGNAGRDALEREARRLGLQRSDLVVRRHLVQMMRLAVERLGPEDLPSEAELETYLARHADDFAEPARVRLTQVYFSEDARGAAAVGDATRLLDELRRTARGPAAAARRGDAFIRGATVDGTPAELERAFGPAFAEAAAAAPIGTWVGPVPSSYGVHLVWVEARAEARTPPLAAVRGRVVHAWLRAHGEQRAAETLRALRARYDVTVVRP